MQNNFSRNNKIKKFPMKKNRKFLLLCLEERNGEYEYLHRSVHELPDSRTTTANRFVKEYAKEFYGGETKFEDGGYSFHNGEIFVKVNSWQVINEEDYNILRKYI